MSLQKSNNDVVFFGLNQDCRENNPLVIEDADLKLGALL
jgi:hypothetical protein